MRDRAPSCVILGAGGHARVLLDTLQAASVPHTFGILDPSPNMGETLYGVPILGDDSLLPELAAAGCTHFVVAVGSVGDASVRRRLFERALGLQLVPLGVRHPSAIVSPRATIGAGAQILPGAIVNAGAQLGVNVIVNSGAVVEHDCTIGNHVHVATGARLASTVIVGDGAHIGVGAAVRQCINIGAEAVVGAGAVVVKDVPPSTVVAGVPAATLRIAGKAGV